MPRQLGTDLCQLQIQDNISGSDIVLFYRMPTTQERMAYSNESFQRRRNKVVSRMAETRQKFGTRILTDIREGDFEKQAGEKYVPIASDPKSPHYDAEWKEHIKTHASDLIQLLAVHVFDLPAEAFNEDDLGEPDEALAEDDIEKN